MPEDFRSLLNSLPPQLEQIKAKVESRFSSDADDGEVTVTVDFDPNGSIAVTFAKSSGETSKISATWGKSV